DANVVDVSGDLGKQFAHLDPAAAELRELERRAHQLALDAVARLFGRRVLAVEFLQAGLRVEGIDVRGAAVHEQVNDALCASGELTRPGGEWAGRFGSERAGQTEGAETAANTAEHFAARK